MTIDTARMTGRELLEAMLRGDLQPPSMAGTLSFTLTEIGEGRAVFVGTPGAHVLNPMGSVHGGWALAIIDSATGCAGMSLLPAGVSYGTVETHCNFVRPIFADSGRVRCEARVLAHGKTLITAEAQMVDETGRLLAHGGSTLAVFPKRG